jgi:hypothetical protein
MAVACTCSDTPSPAPILWHSYAPAASLPVSRNAQRRPDADDNAPAQIRPEEHTGVVLRSRINLSFHQSSLTASFFQARRPLSALLRPAHAASDADIQEGPWPWSWRAFHLHSTFPLFSFAPACNVLHILFAPLLDRCDRGAELHHGHPGQVRERPLRRLQLVLQLRPRLCARARVHRPVQSRYRRASGPSHRVQEGVCGAQRSRRCMLMGGVAALCVGHCLRGDVVHRRVLHAHARRTRPAEPGPRHSCSDHHPPRTFMYVASCPLLVRRRLTHPQGSTRSCT